MQPSDDEKVLTKFSRQAADLGAVFLYKELNIRGRTSISRKSALAGRRKCACALM